MSVHAPATIASQLNIPPVLAPEALSFANIRDSGFPPASKEFPGLRSDGYQVALLSMDTNGAMLEGAGQSARIPHLLVLSLTWDDLIKHLRSEADRSQPNGGSDVARFGEVLIDFPQYEARRADQPVELTAMEFKILKFFISHPYRVISRDELLDKVWGYDCYPSTRTVDNRILSLRQKLERDPANPVHFQTVHGAGYKFVPC